MSSLHKNRHLYAKKAQVTFCYLLSIILGSPVSVKNVWPLIFKGNVQGFPRLDAQERAVA